MKAKTSTQTQTDTDKIVTENVVTLTVEPDL